MLGFWPSYHSLQDLIEKWERPRLHCLLGARRRRLRGLTMQVACVVDAYMCERVEPSSRRSRCLGLLGVVIMNGVGFG